jgi:hypothetical protein
MLGEKLPAENSIRRFSQSRVVLASRSNGLQTVTILVIVLTVLSTPILITNSQYAFGTSCTIEMTEPRLTSVDTRPIVETAAGEQIVISTTITNQCSHQDQPFIVFIEVRNSDGITEYIGWQSGVIKIFTRSNNISVNWTPDRADNYELRTFAISGFETLEIISPLIKKSVVVIANRGSADPSVKEPFTIILIPDTQNYWNGGNEQMAYNQSKWIIENKEKMNIKLVIHLGDIVNNWNNKNHWIKADNMMKILDDNEISYLALVGNHDFGNHYSSTANRDYSYFERYFPDSRLVSNHTLEYKKITPNGANMYAYLTVGNNDFLVVSMEYCPTLDVAKKVSEIIKQNADKQVILATHAFLRSNGSWTSVSGGGICTKIAGTDDYSTKAIWDLVVYPNPNVFLVVSGHSGGENKRIDYNVAERPVQQVVIDYQYKQNGGDGMLKIIRFEPENDKIQFQTYSPWFDQYLSGAKSKFTFDYEMN